MSLLLICLCLRNILIFVCMMSCLFTNSLRAGCSAAGRKTLIFVGAVNACDALQTFLASRAVPAQSIHRDVEKEDVAKYLHEFGAFDGRCLSCPRAFRGASKEFCTWPFLQKGRFGHKALFWAPERLDCSCLVSCHTGRHTESFRCWFHRIGLSRGFYLKVFEWRSRTATARKMHILRDGYTYSAHAHLRIYPSST